MKKALLIVELTGLGFLALASSVSGFNETVVQTSGVGYPCSKPEKKDTSTKIPEEYSPAANDWKRWQDYVL